MLEVSFGVIGIDNIDSVASKENILVDDILREVGLQVQKIFRTDDIVGSLDQRMICGLLFDCSTEDAQKAFMRVKTMIEKNGIMVEGKNEPVKLTLSAGYMPVDKESMPQVIIDKCIRAVEKAQAAGGNRIYEAVE